MRPLSEDETKQVFEKLYKFIGKNIKSLIDRPDEPYCFRLQKNRIYYVREALMKKATNVSEGYLGGAGLGRTPPWPAIDGRRRRDHLRRRPKLPTMRTCMHACDGFTSRHCMWLRVPLAL